MNRITNDNKGVALAFTVLLTVVLMITGTMLLNLSLSETRFSVRSEELLQAEYIAKSGADIVAQQFLGEDDQSTLPSDATIPIGSGSSSGTAVVTAAYAGELIRIESIGTVGTSPRKVCLYLAPNQPMDVFSGIWQTSANPNHTYELFKDSNIQVTNNATITFPPDYADNYVNPDSNQNDETTHSALINLPEASPPTTLSSLTLSSSGIISESSEYNHKIAKNTNITLEAGDGEILTVVLNEIENPLGSVTISGSGLVNLFLNGKGGTVEIKGSINKNNSGTLFIFPINCSIFNWQTGSEDAANCYIYGPTTTLDFTGTGSNPFAGAVVGKEFISNGKVFTFDPPDQIDSSYVSISGISMGYHKQNYADN